MSPRAATFDVDGTLYDSARLRRAFVVRNLLRLRPVRAARRVREELRGESFVDGEGYFAEEARRVAALLGMEPLEARACLDELFGARLLDALKSVGPRRGARASLELLVERGVAIAAVSDYRVDDKLAALGLADLPWRALVAADALGALKPSPRAFERAAALLDVAPREIVHVGDRVDTDVTAARAAGFDAILLGSADGVPCAATLMDAARMILGR